MKREQAVVLLAFVIGFVLIVSGLFKLSHDLEEEAKRISESFVQACQSVGGKAVWNKRFWECLR
jgi:uncharacterized membrane protein HdeD (DUF308 family)